MERKGSKTEQILHDAFAGGSHADRFQNALDGLDA